MCMYLCVYNVYEARSLFCFVCFREVLLERAMSIGRSWNTFGNPVVTLMTAHAYLILRSCFLHFLHGGRFYEQKLLSVPGLSVPWRDTKKGPSAVTAFEAPVSGVSFLAGWMYHQIPLAGRRRCKTWDRSGETSFSPLCHFLQWHFVF